VHFVRLAQVLINLASPMLYPLPLRYTCVHSAGSTVELFAVGPDAYKTFRSGVVLLLLSTSASNVMLQANPLFQKFHPFRSATPL
jgi:hypothetical protein